MIGIILAIYASFFLALSQGSLKKSFKDFEPSVAFLLDAIIGLIIWIPLSLFFGVGFSHLPQALIYALISAILSEALYFYALSKGQLSITAILIASYPIYTILFSYFLNGERLQSVQLIFISITILGTLLTYLPSKLNFLELKKSGAIFWPILAAIAVGLSDTLSKGIIDKTADFSFLFALALIQIPVAIIYLYIQKQNGIKILSNTFNHTWEYKNVIMGSLFNIIGTSFLWISFSKTLASIASPITASSGALVVLLALIFLDEKINLRSVFGLLLVLAGIIGISFYVS